jgi:mono/diheme cytochrome c family protein
MSSGRFVAALLLAAAAAQFRSGPGWPTEMVKSPATGELRAPPPGAVSIAAEPELTRDEAGKLLTNPLPASAETLARGKRLFDVYCAVCHGATGVGDGPVAGKFGMGPKLPPLFAFAVRPDGHLYGTIRNGGFIMPAYGDSLSVEERWAVVHHLRTLQKR